MGDLMEENIKILNEINKGACMGLDSIKIIQDKVDDEDFKNYLKTLSKKYEKITRKVNELYYKYAKNDDPTETNMMNKAMLWSGIEMKTLTDTSDSKLAELLLEGTNMGIIEGRKIYNNKNGDDEVFDIVDEFIIMQEQSVEELKRFL